MDFIYQKSTVICDICVNTRVSWVKSQNEFDSQLKTDDNFLTYLKKYVFIIKLLLYIIIN